MEDEVTLPITYDDLSKWRRERDCIQPELEALQSRYRTLVERIRACELIIQMREKETPPAPAQTASVRDEV